MMKGFGPHLSLILVECYICKEFWYRPFGTGGLAVVPICRLYPILRYTDCTHKRGILNFARCGRLDGLLSVRAVAVSTTEPFARKAFSSFISFASISKRIGGRP